MVVPGEYYKTRHILLSDSANCTVLRAVVLTQYRRVTDRRTDGQTDGIAIASTALAMRALRRAVKITGLHYSVNLLVLLAVEKVINKSFRLIWQLYYVVTRVVGLSVLSYIKMLTGWCKNRLLKNASQKPSIFHKAV